MPARTPAPRRPRATAAFAAAAALLTALLPLAAAQAYPKCSPLQLKAFQDYSRASGAPCAESSLVQIPSGCATAPGFDPEVAKTPSSYTRAAAFGTCSNATRTHCGGPGGATLCVHVRSW